MWKTKATVFNPLKLLENAPSSPKSPLSPEAVFRATPRLGHTTPCYELALSKHTRWLALSLQGRKTFSFFTVGEGPFERKGLILRASWSPVSFKCCQPRSGFPCSNGTDITRSEAPDSIFYLVIILKRFIIILNYQLVMLTAIKSFHLCKCELLCPSLVFQDRSFSV